MHVPKSDTTSQYLLMCTKLGVVKKTAVERFENVRSSGLIAIGLNEGDELKWIRQSSGADDVVISTSLGQAIRFNESDVRAMGRSACGVRGIKLRPRDEVVAMDVVSESDHIFVISSLGYGKKTKVAHFTKHRRGGMGIKAAVVNKKTGHLVAVWTLRSGADEIIIISTKGQTIRLGLKDIPTLGRATQGVRIMRLNESDTVGAAALVLEPPVTDEVASTEDQPAES